MTEADTIAAGLTEAQQEAVKCCERDGNGAHIWSIWPLVRAGLMSLVAVPELAGIKAYRLNERGLAVRATLHAHKDLNDGFLP